jgi:hypothetical protein
MGDLDRRVTANCTSRLETRPLVREGAPQHEDRKCPTVIKNLVVGPKWGPATKMDWLTDRRSKYNLNLSQGADHGTFPFRLNLYYFLLHFGPLGSSTWLFPSADPIMEFFCCNASLLSLAKTGPYVITGAQSTCRRIERLVNTDLERVWKEAAVT